MTVLGPAYPRAGSVHKGSTWIHFLKSIATFKGDLSTITAPPFLTAPISAIEFPTCWADQPNNFTALATETDPAKRALLVLRFYLSTFYQANITRKEALGCKKPLNPFLGELFSGTFEGEAVGTTKFLSEQVCHHPPVTAMYINNREHGISLQGYGGAKIRFVGSVDIKQIGHLVIHLSRFNETYILTLPDLQIKGLLTGDPYAEIYGSSYIYSSTGLTSQIDFSGKGWFSGKKNTVKATLYSSRQQDNALYQVTGQWNKELVFKDLKNESIIEIYDCSAASTVPISVKPLDKQSPWESRRAWSTVTEAIRANDMFATGHEKSKIEIGQRELRKKEHALGKTWEPAFFTNSDRDDMLENIGVHDQLKGHHERTKGIWRFDESKAEKNGERPMHGCDPTG